MRSNTGMRSACLQIQKEVCLIIDHLSIRVVPVVAIVIMGVLAIGLVTASDRIFRENAIQREQGLIRDAFAARMDQVLDGHERNAVELAGSLLGDRMFAKAVASSDVDYLRTLLGNTLRNAGQRTGNRDGAGNPLVVAVSDASQSLLVQSSSKINIRHCRPIMNMAVNSGSESGKGVASGFCIEEAAVYYMTAVTVGDGIPSAYVQVVHEPMQLLGLVAEKLGVFLKAGFVNGETFYHSPGWPRSQSEHYLLSDLMVPAIPYDSDLQMVVAKDMKTYYESMDKISYMVTLVAAAIMIIALFMALTILQKSVIDPLQKLTMHVRRIKGDQRHLGDNVRITGNAEVAELSSNINEMTARLGTMYESLERLAFKDPLTNLPNRALLRDRLEQTLLSAAQNKRTFALMILDLDRFKEINDTLGHQMGDLVLQQVGVLLNSRLELGDTMGRLGGDEFAVLMHHADEKAAVRMARDLLNELKQVIKVEDHSFYLGASIGIALFPEHGKTASELLQRADVAMYAAKGAKTGFGVYNTALDQHNPERLALAGDLRDAVINRKFILHYQPKLDIKSNMITSVEALVRWPRGSKKSVPPDIFIPMLEQTGQVTELSRWVIEQSLVQARKWRDAGKPLTVSVNLSVRDLQVSDIVTVIFDLLTYYQLPASVLDLEITESSVMTDPLRALAMLKKLSEAGLSITIDDFGTGYSSLSYLKKFPAKAMKIDKSFVIGMDVDANDDAIVRASVDLAHYMGLKVVAEGVESARVLGRLREIGCDAAQGYHVGRPLPIDEFEHWLALGAWKLASVG